MAIQPQHFIGKVRSADEPPGSKPTSVVPQDSFGAHVAPVQQFVEEEPAPKKTTRKRRT